ncbi:MAG: protein kinase [Blastocatellia bacterium]|nr:protein kinase [Blastocatellia bacterium]
MSVESGTLGPYEILARLGSGGMGEVYLAHDPKLRRRVALKFLPQDMIVDKQADEHLAIEASAAASLNHPRIATIYELRQEESLCCIVMEYVEGQTLKDRIKETAFEISEAVAIALQIAEALKAAHARGLLHCDIKSSNIMLTPEGDVKVLDFGLSRLMRRPDAGAPHQTGETAASTGVAKDTSNMAEPDGVAGTPGYLSPEQARGEPLDARTDIFSFGIVLYEMVSGRLPFEGEGRRDLLRAMLESEPPPLGTLRDGVPLELESIVRRCLEKNPDRRYDSASEILSELEQLKSDLDAATAFEVPAGETSRREVETERPSYSLKPSPLGPAALWLFRHRRWLMAAGALALVAAGFDLLILQPQGSGRARDLGLFVIAAVSFIGYIALLSQSGRLRRSFSRAASSAFRGLLPFQEQDRDRFYGRETETSALFDMVAHDEFRFGVLYGESGCGKTSLIRAGLIPNLLEKGHTALYCRSHRDPLAVILEQCRKHTGLAAQEHEPALDFLRRASEKAGAGLVIICDQFEEFFVNFRTKESRAPFVSLVAACNQSSDLRVKFLFSMRSDFLYLIGAEFDGLVVEPLMMAKRFHLRNLDRERAEEIIERSARQARLPLEAGLSRQVARDLVTGGEVLPSELQIVGEQLQSKRIYTAQEYRQAGGKEQLVHSYLEEVIEATGERDSSALVLRSLISDENTRLTLTLAEIVRRTQCSSETVERILELFAQARLVREIQDEEPWRYELMHEYLIDRINQITGRVMDATQRANRLLRQYLSNYSVDKRARIPANKLWFIKRYSDAATASQARELFGKSLRRGVVQAGGLLVLFMIAATLAAAWLSVSEEWEEVRLSDGHRAAVRKAAFSPDGRLLVSVGEDAKVMVWDFARRERLATFNDHTDWINSVAFSPDGRLVATGAEVVILWDAITRQKIAPLDYPSIVWSVVFSPDGRWLVSTHGDGTIQVWDVAERRRVVGLNEHSDSVRTVAWSRDGKRVASAGEDRSIIVWDAESERKETVLMGHPTRVVGAGFTPDGRRLVSVDRDGLVIVWNLAERQPQLQFTHQDMRLSHCLAISPDGRWIATTKGVYEHATGLQVISFYTVNDPVLSLKSLTDSYGMTFSADGRWLAIVTRDGYLVLWDTATWKVIDYADISPTSLIAVSFSNDGRWLVTGEDEGVVRLWSVQPLKEVAVLGSHTARIKSVAFSPDGRRVVSAGDDQTIALWDVGSRSLIMNIGTHTAPVLAVAFSPDGKQILSGEHDRSVRLYTRHRALWGYRLD